MPFLTALAGVPLIPPTWRADVIAFLQALDLLAAARPSDSPGFRQRRSRHSPPPTRRPTRRAPIRRSRQERISDVSTWMEHVTVGHLKRFKPKVTTPASLPDEPSPQSQRRTSRLWVLRHYLEAHQLPTLGLGQADLRPVAATLAAKYAICSQRTCR